jgi:hypothetical protein
MLGKIASLLPAANPGFRINLFSAALSALTVSLFFLFVSGVLGGGVAASFAGAMVLAFSSTFWQQGIEAKGSIYILNALLMLAQIGCFLKDRDSKFFYLLCFLAGLSLSNHYQSAVITLPMLLFSFYRNWKKAAVGILLFLFGITPYIFISLRGWAQAPPRWADTSTLQGFLFLVLRQGYPQPAIQGHGAILYQFGEIAKQVYSNFSMLAVLAIPGLWHLFRKNSEAAAVIVITALLNVLLVVFFNNVPLTSLWFISLFVMPFFVLFAVMTAFGLSWIGVSLQKGIAAPLLICAIPLALLFSNHDRNMMSHNYISYDLGNNISMTLAHGSLFIPEGDYLSMPYTYVVYAGKNEKELKYFSFANLNYAFGFDDLEKVSGVRLKGPEEFKSSIDEIAKKQEVYSNFSSHKDASVYIEPDKWSPRGLLYRYGRTRPEPWFFSVYSYRSISAGEHGDFEDNIVYLYPASMAWTYHELIKEGKRTSAESLIKKAALFPNIDLIKMN